MERKHIVVLVKKGLWDKLKMIILFNAISASVLMHANDPRLYRKRERERSREHAERLLCHSAPASSCDWPQGILRKMYFSVAV